MSLSTNHKVSALRSAILAAVTVGLMLAPASAQADPVREGNCTAQLTAVEGEDAATFTIRCSEDVQGLQFRTSEDVVVFPRVVQPSGSDPTHGFPCLPPAGREVTCQSGPPPLGSPGLASGETGTITLETMDPCGNELAIVELIVDTGAQGEEGAGSPEEDVNFDREVRVQCEGGGGGGGGGDGRGDERPEGGVDAGFGGMSKPSTAGVPATGLPLALGSGLLGLGLLGGVLSLARRL